MAFPGLRISVGDLGATFGAPAGQGVVILEAGVPTSYIISPPVPFQVQAQIRTALGALDYTLPGVLTTSFHVQDLITGTPVPGSPFAGLAPTPMAAPLGDSGPGGLFDHVNWYSINSPVIPALPAGTYKITVIGAGGGVLFVHSDTIIQVAL